MREILFRGKRMNPSINEWIYGHVRTYKKNGLLGASILKDNVEDVLIYIETLGQYTGIVTKNDLQKIFEYDIIDADGRKVGNYYENKYLLENGTNLLIEKMGTREWSRSEQEAIKRGCKYAE